MPDDVSGKVGLDTTDWKTGVSDINRDVRTIESGFKAVAAGMDDWRKSADGLSARNDALTGIIDKQKQKVALLEAEYDRMKQEAAENGDETERTANALQDFEIKINAAKEQLAKSETELRKNSTALDEMGADTGDAGKEVKDLGDKSKDTEKKTSSFADALKKAGEIAGKGLVAAAKAAGAAIAAIGTATVAATKQAFDFAKGAGEMADNVLTLSAQTGVSAEQLQKWQYASNFVDVSVDTMTGSMAKMVKQMGDAAGGSKTAKEKFEALGISIRDKTTGELRDSEDVFADAITALGNISNTTERDALAMDLFGKSAQELNPLILAGGDALKQLGDEAVQMGTVVNGDALAAMGAFDDSMQKFNATGESLKNVIGMTVMPAFQPLVDTATGAMAQISVALQDGLQPGEFETITQNIIGTLQTSLTGITQIVSDAIPLVSEGLNTVIGTLVTALPGMIGTLLPAAMSLIQGLLDGILANLDGFISLALTLVTTLADFLIQNVPTLLTAAIAIFQGLVNGIIAHLPELIPVAVDMLVKLALALVDAIPNLVAAIPQIIAAIMNGLLQVDWLNVGFQILTGVINGIIGTVGSLLTAMGNIIGQITSAITGTDWGQIGSNLLNGIANGMSNMVSSVKEKVTGFFKDIWGGVKSFFGIHSPSTVAADDGKNIMQGMQEGMQNAQPSALDKVKGVFRGIWDGIKSIFGFGGGDSTDAAEAKKTGESVTKGVADGINGAGADAEQGVKTLSTRIIELFRTELGVSSGPSTKTQPFGANAAMGVITGLQSMLSSLRSAAKDVGDAICDGIAQGIRNGASAITAAAKKAALAALNAAKAQLGIQSPSKVMAAQVGLPAVQGIAQGLEANAGLLKKSMQNLAGNMTVKVGSVEPITVSGKAGGGGKTIVSAALQLDRRTFGQVVLELADEGQGLAASNQTRYNMGVVLA